MATAADVSAVVTEIEAIADSILKELEAVPAIAGAAGIADTVVELLGSLLSKALLAWSAASGTPITVESVQALLPNSTPLTEPTPTTVSTPGKPVDPLP